MSGFRLRIGGRSGRAESRVVEAEPRVASGTPVSGEEGDSVVVAGVEGDAELGVGPERTEPGFVQDGTPVAVPDTEEPFGQAGGGLYPAADGVPGVWCDGHLLGDGVPLPGGLVRGMDPAVPGALVGQAEIAVDAVRVRPLDGPRGAYRADRQRDAEELEPLLPLEAGIADEVVRCGEPDPSQREAVAIQVGIRGRAGVRGRSRDTTEPIRPKNRPARTSGRPAAASAA